MSAPDTVTSPTSDNYVTTAPVVWAKRDVIHGTKRQNASPRRDGRAQTAFFCLRVGRAYQALLFQDRSGKMKSVTRVRSLPPIHAVLLAHRPTRFRPLCAPLLIGSSPLLLIGIPTQEALPAPSASPRSSEGSVCFLSTRASPAASPRTRAGPDARAGVIPGPASAQFLGLRPS